ncbi:MAG TPA: DUF2075 domain-containing protein [Xanthomonadaceae bacterium]|nr:DUF2075 domain-containing protein [Xanthomonadaceae bacterium]
MPRTVDDVQFKGARPSSRSLYADDIADFRSKQQTTVLGELVAASAFEISPEQRDAWGAQIALLQSALVSFESRGRIYFEYVIPRLGKRVDVILVIDHALFVIEFKVGATAFHSADIEQVWDYALDLRNFHSASHHVPVVPILVATRARTALMEIGCHAYDRRMCDPIAIGSAQIGEAIDRALQFLEGPRLRVAEWEQGRYSPTPTIIEAARALYAHHSVEEISRSGADATNLTHTSRAVDEIINDAMAKGKKAICFVTGVPGAGKTLVGLDVAIRHDDTTGELRCVFLSGNGPLVAVLREALARDLIRAEKSAGRKLTKKDATRRVSAFIQNVHHFRDGCLVDEKPPHEHVALFDEAQRAWDLAQTKSFMRRKKGVPDFDQSEPEFLISCMDRHVGWAVIVCLVGGGQEINTGEAGISGWIGALSRRFPDWEVHLPTVLRESEYRCAKELAELGRQRALLARDDLHLATSMRSFRAERVSEFVRLVLDLEIEAAALLCNEIVARYPVWITRNLDEAKEWLRARARGSERFGMIVSSQAQRLKPHAIDVRTPVDPVQWFLNAKDDVRSSFYLEDVATEFQVQGLELDWACVVWDADLRIEGDSWTHHEFRGTRWIRINKAERKRYLENAYRVLLTRARQGLVVVVPKGEQQDATRDPALYDETFVFLRRAGFPLLDRLPTPQLMV